MASSTIALVSVVLICLLLRIRSLLANLYGVPRGLKKLPGPKGYPIIGSVPDVPEKNGFIKFFEWGKEYGPIYQVNLAGHNHVWICSDEIARELLSKKGSIYSDRPHIPALIADNRTSAQYLPLLSRNSGWTRQRKFANAIMRESERAIFHRYPELEAKRMLVELIEEPGRYNHALESFVSRVTCRLAWGHSEASDELKQRARELLIGVSPTGALGNKVPFLMSLPDWLIPAKAWERRRAATERRWFEIMQGEVEADMRKKKAPQSWMRMYLEDKLKWGFKYALEGAYCVGMHGIAGALTIAAPMQTFCLAMCYYPQFLPMLHEELDRVCGDRLPRSEDRPNLPFLRAVIRECLRWRPPVPTGIPHYLSEDDEWNGYHIPKGSTIHPLEWAIARDPELFPEPEVFNPLRWVTPGYPTYREPLSEYPTIINSTQFGYGRRICQGQTVADEDLLIGLGSVAWLFNIALKNEDNIPSVNHSGHNKPEKREGIALGMSIELPNKLNGLTLENIILNKYKYPGSFPVNGEPASKVVAIKSRKSQEPESRAKVEESKSSKGKSKHDSENIDPTLDFTTLLIAKPLPFKFNLTPRDERRVAIVRKLYTQGVRNGEFTDSREYWGPNQGRNQPLGWGKV